MASSSTPIRTSAILALALAAAGTAPRAQTTEYTTFEPLWYHTPALPQGGACRAMGLLNLPPGWSSGDAAVVVLTARGLRDASRDPLVAGLLHQGAAVLEIVADSFAQCDGDPDGTARPAPPHGPAAALRGARDALAIYGAGLLVAIGYGGEGDVVLQAVEADRLEGRARPRFAAGVSIRAGEARFAAGARPASTERWHERAPHLCAVLAAAFQDAGRHTERCTVTFHAATETPVATVGRGAPR